MHKVYVVHYGDHTSEFRDSSWNEACAFMRQCLREGTRIRGVWVEQQAGAHRVIRGS